MGCGSRYARRMMKLHNYFRSSASYRVRIALNIKGLAYDYVPVHIARGEHHQPPFADIAPEQLVPLLEEDESSGGERISQSMAIIEYLDETNPEPPLLPHDPVGRARVRTLSQIVACEIHPINNLRVLKYLVRELKVDEAAKNAWYRHWVRDGMEAFERQLALHPGSTFCYGDTPTLADCCLVPQLYNARRFGVDLSAFPTLVRVEAECLALPEFDRARPENQIDAPAPSSTP